MDVRKFQRVPPFTFFGTVTLFKNHILKFFWAIFLSPQRVPPSIFFIFCHQLEFNKTQRVPPFTILSLRYSADFGRSRLVSSKIGLEFNKQLYEHHGPIVHNVFTLSWDHVGSFLFPPPTIKIVRGNIIKTF